MPAKLDSGDSVNKEYEKNKTKKGRYSLRKFLDKSRFSPRLLSLSKRVVCKYDDFGKESKADSKSLKENSFNSAKTDSVNLSSQSIPTSLSLSPGLGENVPTTSHSYETHSAENVGNSLTGLDNTSLHSECVVEEDYEDSLAQFASIILDPVKEALVPVKAKSSDSLLAWFGGPSSDTDQVQNDDCRLGLKSTGDLVVHDSLVNLKLDKIHPTAIYNEPCDAKSEVDDPTTIYTMSDVIQQSITGDGGKNAAGKKLLMDESSGVIVSTINSLTTPVNFNQNGHQSVGLDNQIKLDKIGGIPPGAASNKGNLSTKNHLAFGRDKVNGSNSLETILESQSNGDQLGAKCQSGANFSNCPRGNTVIVHHPFSPFAPVPRTTVASTSTTHAVPIFGISANGTRLATDLDQCTLSLDQVNQQPDKQSSVCHSANLPIDTSNANGHLGMSDELARLDLYVTTTSSTDSNPTSTVATTSLGVNQMYPTYEEAWDVKMARQHGLDISRSISSKKCSKSAEGADATVAALRPGGSTDVASTSTKNSKLSGVFNRLGEDINHEDSDSPTVAEEADVQLKAAKNASLYENCKQTQESNERIKLKETAEYDYAYNGSWSMGVKMNLNLAMNNDIANNYDTSPIDESNGQESKSNCQASTSVLVPNPTDKVLQSIQTDSTKSPGTCVVNTPTSAVGSRNHHHHHHHYHHHHHHHHRAHQLGNANNNPLCPGDDPTDLASAPIGANNSNNGTKPNCCSNSSHFGQEHVDTTAFDDQGCYDESWDTKQSGRLLSELNRGSMTLDSCPVLPSDKSTIGNINPNFKRVEYFNKTDLASQPSSLLSSKSGLPRKLSSSLEFLTLKEQPWFHEDITRTEAEDLIRNEPEGSFLVRPSETSPNNFSLTIKHKTFLHMKISRNNAGLFVLGEYSQPYTNVTQMIYHYARTLVPVRGADSVTLTHPVYVNNSRSHAN